MRDPDLVSDGGQQHRGELTARELEVARAIATGRSNAEIPAPLALLKAPACGGMTQPL